MSIGRTREYFNRIIALKHYVVQSFRDLFPRNLLTNLKASYSLEAVMLLVPLITLPYLARILGPGTFGLLALTQAFMLYIGVLIEYGFKYSATRDVSQNRKSNGRLSDILAGVLGARVLFSVGGVLIAITAAHFFSHFRDQPYLVWASLFWVVSKANSLDWYYRGLERTKVFAYMEISPAVISIAAIFLLVKAPADVWLVPFVRGTAGLVSLIASYIFAYRTVPFRLPTPTLVIHAIKLGWPAFIFKGTASLSSVGNSFILGLVMPLHIVGYYAGAEKIMRAMLVFVYTANWSLYPHLSRLIVTSIEQAAKLVRFTLMLLVVLASGAALIVIFISPLLINFALGSGFEKAQPALLVLMGMLPLTAVSIVLGTQWMFALGMETQFTKIVAATGLIRLVGIVLLAPHLGHVGVAIAAVIAQAVEALATYVLLSSKNLNPFQRHIFITTKTAIDSNGTST